MMTLILKIVASAAGVFATYYIGKKAVAWINEWNHSHQTADDTDARTQASADDQKDNQDSDVLKDIDGR